MPDFAGANATERAARMGGERSSELTPLLETSRNLADRHVEPDASGLGPVRAFVEPFVTAGMARLYRDAQSIASAHPTAPFDPHRATRLFEPLLWGPPHRRGQ